MSDEKTPCMCGCNTLQKRPVQLRHLLKQQRRGDYHTPSTFSEFPTSSETPGSSSSLTSVAPQKRKAPVDWSNNAERAKTLNSKAHNTTRSATHNQETGVGSSLPHHQEPEPSMSASTPPVSNLSTSQAPGINSLLLAPPSDTDIGIDGPDGLELELDDLEDSFLRLQVRLPDEDFGIDGDDLGMEMEAQGGVVWGGLREELDDEVVQGPGETLTMSVIPSLVDLGEAAGWHDGGWDKRGDDAIEEDWQLELHEQSE